MLGEVTQPPLLPEYGGACVTNLARALLEPARDPPPWLPAPAIGAERVVLLLLDGVGWEQLLARRHLAPTLTAMAGGPITSVLPTTTAAALTSISTGLPPGEHGVVGYRIHVYGEVLNVLRWTTAAGDARQTIPPAKIQTHPAFLGHRPPVVTRAEFLRTGFTSAHLDRTRFTGYRMASTLVTEVARLVRGGEPFVYAYYDGVDKVAHEYGLGAHYDAELAAADDIAADLLSVLPERRRSSRRRRRATATTRGSAPGGGRRRGLVRPARHGRQPRAPGRRRPGRPHAGRLHRAFRHRPLRSCRPARFGDVGRADRSPARPHHLTEAPPCPTTPIPPARLGATSPRSSTGSCFRPAPGPMGRRAR